MLGQSSASPTEVDLGHVQTFQNVVKAQPTFLNVSGSWKGLSDSQSR